MNTPATPRPTEHRISLHRMSEAKDGDRLHAFTHHNDHEQIAVSKGEDGKLLFEVWHQGEAPQFYPAERWRGFLTHAELFELQNQLPFQTQFLMGIHVALPQHNTERGLPGHVSEWLKQFPGETITINMADNGNVRRWSREEKIPRRASSAGGERGMD